MINFVGLYLLLWGTIAQAREQVFVASNTRAIELAFNGFPTSAVSNEPQISKTFAADYYLKDGGNEISLKLERFETPNFRVSFDWTSNSLVEQDGGRRIEVTFEKVGDEISATGSFAGEAFATTVFTAGEGLIFDIPQRTIEKIAASEKVDASEIIFRDQVESPLGPGVWELQAPALTPEQESELKTQVLSLLDDFRQANLEQIGNGVEYQLERQAKSAGANVEDFKKEQRGMLTYLKGENGFVVPQIDLNELEVTQIRDRAIFRVLSKEGPIKIGSEGATITLQLIYTFNGEKFHRVQ